MVVLCRLKAQSDKAQLSFPLHWAQGTNTLTRVFSSTKSIIYMLTKIILNHKLTWCWNANHVDTPPPLFGTPYRRLEMSIQDQHLWFKRHHNHNLWSKVSHHWIYYEGFLHCSFLNLLHLWFHHGTLVSVVGIKVWFLWFPRGQDHFESTAKRM